MTPDPFDPADPECWRARGRSAEHSTLLADVWTRFPDLPPSVPLDERMARSRARVAAMRPINDAMAAETERKRQEKNFAFTEGRLATGTADDRDIAILRGRDAHGYDWDRCIQYAYGWHDAHSGSDYHPFVSTRDLIAAYDRGFSDGGGDKSDLFDTARRAMRARDRMSNHPPAPAPVMLARVLPSTWQKPTDTPRPTRWERRLILIAGEELQPAPTGAPLLDHFRGNLFDMIRGHAGAREARIVIVTPTDGFRLATDIMQPAGAGTMTPARAAALAQDDAQRQRLGRTLADRDFDDILVIAEGPALDVIDAHAPALPLCRTMERTRHTPLLRRAQLRFWLDRGLAPGTVMASGHIRWGKVIHGLTGRLGDFSTRYVKPVSGRAHLVIVEKDGAVATGFMAPDGTPLDPLIPFSNRSRTRAVMASALRAFAASLPVPLERVS